MSRPGLVARQCAAFRLGRPRPRAGADPAVAV